MQIELGGSPILLLPQKAIFLPEPKILVVADLHLGKAMHFRKAGIFIPAAATVKDYETLNGLIELHRPEEVWFLGDLFHSAHNSEWNQFSAFVRSRPSVAFTLVKGNHDIIDLQYYRELGVSVEPHYLQVGNLLFSHEPLETVPEKLVNLAGHIHPGCSVYGGARQAYRLPCYYYKGNTFLLPAFGYLTGLVMMDQRDATVYALFPNEVVQL